MSTSHRNSREGIETRHQRDCAIGRGLKRCNCTPTYRASVYSAREKRRIRASFPTRAAARTWRADAGKALLEGRLRAASPQTLREAADTFIAGISDGSISTRSGAPYKPSTVRSYADALRLRALPAFGSYRLSDLTHRDLQLYVEHLTQTGVGPSRIRNTVIPLRAIFSRARALGDVAVDPCVGLRLPPLRGRRDRVADPAEGAALLAALPEGHRAIWATAMYAGLRIGELQALAWDDIDLAKNVIRVERSWDRKAGVIDVKSHAGRRSVPISSTLRTFLLAHRLRQGQGGAGLVFGGRHGLPFNPSNLRRDAYKAWDAVGAERIAPHECRHSFASLMIAAGVNAKTLATYMGHASVGITLDRYGHLMPGNEAEAAQMLDTYLARAQGTN
jgi:integrase